MKSLLASALILFSTSQVFAAPITPENLIGKYKVEARAGFQKIYVNFRVVSTSEFELQRTYTDGRVDELCNGKYTINPTLLWTDFETLAAGKTFSGLVSCPSDRSRTQSFNIEFINKTTEDLVRGTNVTVEARGMRLNAYVKKQ
ncbi:hypothetical protein [Bdellovibrio reynosensis]|uniref:Uncharacterized protein n=1 Tax=Bdellovibrio reynosensis TaxID=2835041 RepID=A0ABY4C8K1_9BACT|nr:hypothetical protein [Bdellovibrio reynosensis]UOF01260.1 hypothetical protein MNR06_16315 [Bdellovibrio reynosensis]